MKQLQEVVLKAIKCELEVLAGQKNLPLERLDQLREDPDVVKYFELREEDPTGEKALAHAFGLSPELNSALIVLNQERVLMRQALAAMRGQDNTLQGLTS